MNRFYIVSILLLTSSMAKTHALLRSAGQTGRTGAQTLLRSGRISAPLFAVAPLRPQLRPQPFGTTVITAPITTSAPSFWKWSAERQRKDKIFAEQQKQYLEDKFNEFIQELLGGSVENLSKKLNDIAAEYYANPVISSEEDYLRFKKHTNYLESHRDKLSDEFDYFLKEEKQLFPLYTKFKQDYSTLWHLLMDSKINWWKKGNSRKEKENSRKEKKNDYKESNNDQQESRKQKFYTDNHDYSQITPEMNIDDAYKVVKDIRPPKNITDAYSILGATNKTEARQKYMLLMRKFHPDFNQKDATKADRISKMINAAWDIIKN